MRLPRDISGDDLAKALGGYGYQITRQKESHLRLTTQRGVNRGAPLLFAIRTLKKAWVFAADFSQLIARKAFKGGIGVNNGGIR